MRCRRRAFAPPESSPCSPNTTSPTARPSSTHTNTVSTRSASSRGVPATCAPSFTSASAFSRERFHTLTRCPAASKCRIIGAPINPGPQNPTSTMFLVSDMGCTCRPSYLSLKKPGTHGAVAGARLAPAHHANVPGRHHERPRVQDDRTDRLVAAIERRRDSQRDLESRQDAAQPALVPGDRNARSHRRRPGRALAGHAEGRHAHRRLTRAPPHPPRRDPDPRKAEPCGAARPALHPVRACCRGPAAACLRVSIS
ncbi:hypothetical protein F01_210176 [Burkholderia cenocepacia]|nr:hypothetical protein F01_210176 [Burkholderia cenocepacia]